jgi:hypothetical protein
MTYSFAGPETENDHKLGSIPTNRSSDIVVQSTNAVSSDFLTPVDQQTEMATLVFIILLLLLLFELN